MDWEKEFIGLLDEIECGMKIPLFQDSNPLSENDKYFIQYILRYQPQFLLDILEMKQDFKPFQPVVVPLLVNKITESILELIDNYPHNLLHPLQAFSIIRFLCFSSVVSFSENIDVEDLANMKMTLEVSLKLLNTSIPSQNRRRCFTDCCFQFTRWFCG